MRNLLKTALVFIAIGMILCIAGFAIGGNAKTAFSDSTRSLRQASPFSDGSRTDASDKATATKSAYNSSSTTTVQSEFADVTELSFDLGAGSYTIKVSGDTFQLDGHGASIDAKVSGDTWKIDGHSSKDPVTITLPASFRAKSADISLGGGSLQMDAFPCDDLSVDIGGGSATLSFNANSAELDVGAGQAILKNGDANSLDLNVGLGQLTGTLAGSASEYSYDAEAGLGSITFNGKKLVNGLGDASGGSGSRSLTMECGMGSISLNTSKS